HHQSLAPFPTRRSSDLVLLPKSRSSRPARRRTRAYAVYTEARSAATRAISRAILLHPLHPNSGGGARDRHSARSHIPARCLPERSEEHTSELQSRVDLV